MKGSVISYSNGAPQPPSIPPASPSNFPTPPSGSSTGKTLAIVFGSVAAALVLALVAVFVWVVPALTKGTDNDQAGPTAASQETTSTTPSSDGAAVPAPATAAPTSTPALPDGAIALPPGWDALKGPGNVPPDGDPQFQLFVTGESSFQYLTSWKVDDLYGVSTDPVTGQPMQQVARGTEEKDADGISVAFSFFAESEEDKFGSDPVKVKAAIGAIQENLSATPAAELPAKLVGHKCASDFQSSAPETREFRRSLAVVVTFTCKTAAGDDIQAANLFSVTPWGTPQRMGISGHKSYWDANPGKLELLANAYRSNRWKQ